ncbi:hypothetical protein ACIP2X_37440 [Streptomyces sp. NPDC089424]|uniref:hypothetical protein n=1 Tax=Streptomyces sp. NPDC089424 TaxID=3365917 RepID=UPI0038233135
MYLVHVHLRGPLSGDRLPQSTAADITRHVSGREGLIHVSVHPDPENRPVVGLYLRATTLEEAETAAERLWQLVQTALRPLSAWELLRAEVPLLTDDPWGTNPPPP